MTRTKNPQKVKAGKARQQQLRDQLGPEGYADYQKARYAETLAAHPTFHARGAAAANAAQLEAWGPADYVTQRQAAYHACAERYGADFARQMIARAHEQRRLNRLLAPTPAERALRALLSALGLRVLLLLEPFDYCVWKNDSQAARFGPQDAIAEGGVGPYYCDVLLPARALVIEVEGGIHRLTRARDTRRCAFLTAQGLTVLVLTNEQALDSATAREHLAQAGIP